MADSIILQGKFTSNGGPATINLVSSVDWLRVYNITNATANQTTVVPVEWYWQRGFPQAAGWKYLKSNAANAANLSQYVTTGGFSLVDSTGTALGNPVAVTSTTNANPFVVNTGSTTGLSNGSVVRLSSVANQSNVNAFDFSIANLVANTSFTPAVTFANAPGGAGGAGFYRIVNYGSIYYPSSRTIANITQAASAVVTVTVPHKYVVGQVVAFRIGTDFGMSQLNGLSGAITAVTEYTFTVNIDTTGFTAFVWVDFTNATSYPEVLPVGDDTSVALAQVPPISPFSGATVNQAYSGIQLIGGSAAATAGPAGINNDVIYWVAGKSFSVDNNADLIIQ